MKTAHPLVGIKIAFSARRCDLKSRLKMQARLILQIA